MRIRYLLVGAYGLGGIMRAVLNQANALAADHDVEVVSLYRRRAEPRQELHPRITLRALLDRRDDASPSHPVRRRLAGQPSRLVPADESRYARYSRLTDRALTAYLRSLRGGVLVTTGPGLNLLATRYAPRDVVLVGQDHQNMRSRARRPVMFAQLRDWYPRLDALAVLTEADARDWRRLLGDRTRVEVVPNLLSLNGQVLASLDEPVVLAAGSYSHRKGFDRLIRAYAPVARRHDGWQLRIFGRGDQEERLRALVEDSGLAGRVQLPGHTRALHEELARGSVFALSSRSEGFPMVVLEAMSHGLPVVAFDVHTGPAEMITHGRDGLLVPQGDVAGFSRALETLVRDEARRREMGRNAAESVRRFGGDRIKRRWEELFGSLVAAGG